MGDKFRDNELFNTAHVMILISYTIFSAVLIFESLLLSWEKWALVIVTAGLTLSWVIHIRQRISGYIRLWVYSVLMMGTFFFYGVHTTSTYDLAVVMAAVIIIYTMTGVKALIKLCVVTYCITMAYEVWALVMEGTVFTPLDISRTMLHYSIVIMIGWVSTVIIDKWYSVLGSADDQISELGDATTRLSDFLANVSHEIRTPINAVIGLSKVCIKREKDEAIKRDLGAISAAGKRVYEQISDILDYSEIDRGNLAVNYEDYMISSILNDIVTEIRPYKNPRLELVIDVDPGVPSVMNADVYKLKKILWHLIMNGLKYTREGGVYVRITTKPQEYGVNLYIEVTDTGIGMNGEELDKIFDRFYQGDSGRTRTTSGLGLGMSIVSGFVYSMGGFITVESEPDEGTSVRVSIPQTVVDYSECMSISNHDDICVGAFLHFDKYSNPHVREYYNSTVLNITRGLKVSLHRVDNIDSLKKLVKKIQLTHLFVGEEEYDTDVDFMEELSKEVRIEVVANDSFKLPLGSRIKILKKPFYCFPVASVLNYQGEDSEDEGKMVCRNVRVLVVDDEPMNLTVAMGIFNSYGMIVATADSGIEAVSRCKRNSYDIVFMDHMMPGMDGVEAMKRIRAEASKDHEEFPIVALTANAVSSAKEMFIKEGFDGFVSKPIETEELERVLKRVLPVSAITYEKRVSEEDSGENISKKAFERLNDIGIDTEKGMHYCQNDRGFYKSLMLQFATEALTKKVNMERYFESGDLTNYAILVHALKSTAKMIGATELSEKARLLEEAAKASDKTYIDNHHEDMNIQYENITNGIKTAYGVNDDIAGDTSQDYNAEDDGEILEFSPEGESDDASTEEEVKVYSDDDEIMEFLPQE
ncbi:MAG: response regulator [Lachnospiraceae bacterium]|jgi:signal transduction histidine kinase/DNA-binding response OmpR family regulator|nr:response regulator [Lachnospiraceae bacterium]